MKKMSIVRLVGGVILSMAQINAGQAMEEVTLSKSFAFYPPDLEYRCVKYCLQQCDALEYLPADQLLDSLRMAYQAGNKLNLTLIRVDEPSWIACEERIYKENPNYLSTVQSMTILYNVDLDVDDIDNIGEHSYRHRFEVISFYQYLFRRGHCFAQLESLNFGHGIPFSCHVYNEMIDHIASPEALPNLKEIQFHRFEHLQEAGIIALSKFTGMERLMFNFVDRGYADIRFPEETDMKKMNLGIFSISELEALGQMTSLRQLKIFNHTGNNRGFLEYLTDLSNLTYLKVSKKIGGQLSSIPGSFLNLQKLRLDYMDFSAPNPMDHLTNLIDLSISWTSAEFDDHEVSTEMIKNAFLDSLLSMQNLKNLSLKGACFYTDPKALISCLSQIKTLEKLNLMKDLLAGKESLLTNEDLSQLVELPNLTVLNLSSQGKIDDNGLFFLSSLQNLTALNLFGCLQITIQGIQNLIAHNPQLQILFDIEEEGHKRVSKHATPPKVLQGFNFIQKWKSGDPKYGAIHHS